MKKPTARAIAKEQRKLATGLGAAVADKVDVPTAPHTLFTTLCDVMSERRGGRPVALLTRAFPEAMADTTGLWLDLRDQDVIVVEENLPPDHQLVVLGHELWHMHAGHRGHDLGDAAVVARAALSDRIQWAELARHIAARSRSSQEDELAAEGFGLLLGSHMTRWLATPDTRQLDGVARRIGASLGYTGLQG
ncbi:toxin-antitoxin system, toxin component [Streptomyces sp. NPDC052051]|uniref:toxin-antitoxin system, toxin component n=1 Tax=Streptomyces sp. NPDC052051 TaxID=3154649 RepID=UPI003418E0FD